MEDDKFKDLLEDEELRSLRLAALATKKKNEQNANNTESATAQPIDSIVTASNTGSELASNQIPFVQSDRSMHNSYAWRKQNHPQRRRGGGGFSFPKNHRSNLIMITPVSLNEGRNSEEKVPALVLPQHKWCSSINEDSMSPKTLRRTGPTRFNRHGSDSGSSDDESDYESSDNDSGSNETILQDEPSEHFSRLSPGCDNLSDSVEKKRRFSFQSLDSDTFDKSEATSVYKSLKSTLHTDTKQERFVQQRSNDGEQTFNSSDDNKYSTKHIYTTKSSDASEDLVFKQTNSNIGKGETCSDNVNVSLNHLSDTSKTWTDTDVNNRSACYSKDSENSQIWKNSEGFRAKNFLYPMENQHISNDSKNLNDNSANSHYLTDSDLRLELKKRMQEMKSKTACIETNEMNKNRTYSQYSSPWDRNKQGYSHKSDEVGSSSENTYNEVRASSFYQTNTIKQDFGIENDIEHVSSFNQERSCRSNSRERTMQERFSTKDKNRFEHSFRGRRYDRSSSLDRSVHSSSRGRRRNRSSSRDEREKERSSSQSRIKHNYDKKTENSLSPTRNKFQHSIKYNKTNDDQSAAKDRDWYKSSPKENSEWSSGPDRSRRDRSSSSESKCERNRSKDRNKFSSSNSSYDKKHYRDNQSRGRNRCVPNSKYNRNRHERSSSYDRRSSRSVDSKSDHSSSLEKSRRSSSREKNKDVQSSSESESKYRCNSRSSYNPSKFSPNKHKIKNDIFNNQKANVKENDFNKNVMQECSSLQNKLKVTLSSEKLKDDPKVISTKDQSKSMERHRSESSISKEKSLHNRVSYQKYSRVKSSYKSRYAGSRSSSSESSSSSYSSSSTHSCKPKIRSVPSVITPVVTKSDSENKGNINENKSSGKSSSSTIPQSSIHSICTKRNLDNAESNKPSNIKGGRIDGDSKASEGKRVPVHMRLGAFPLKRIIQRTKEVDAAFVNTSSSSDGESVNSKCKRQNIRIVTDIYNAKNNRIDLIQPNCSSDNSAKRPSPDIYKEKFKRVKAHR